MRLILIRHGLTEENKKGIVQGHLPGNLSEEGIEQAKKVALWLKDETIDFIYSSDLKRAVDTTNEIAKYHKEASVYFVEEMRERNLGEFEGRKISDILPSKKNVVEILLPKNGETMENLYKRGKKIIVQMLSKHPNETVLLLGHHGILRAIIAAITNKTHTEHNSMPSLSNTSVSIFETDQNNIFATLELNNIKHLG